MTDPAPGRRHAVSATGLWVPYPLIVGAAVVSGAAAVTADAAGGGGGVQLIAGTITLEAFFAVAALVVTATLVTGSTRGFLGLVGVARPGAAALAGAVAFVAVLVANGLWNVVADPDPTSLFDQLGGRSATNAVLATVVAVAVAPVCEELFCRGLLLNTLRDWTPVPVALVLQAVVFSALHLSVDAFVPLLAFGLAAGILRLRTGTLLVPMALHATNNVLALLGDWYR